MSAKEIIRLFEIRNLKLFIVIYMNIRPIEGGLAQGNSDPQLVSLCHCFCLSILHV